MDTWTTNRIASLKETIEKAQKELAYLEACTEFLYIVENTTENYCSCLASHYKTNFFNPFEHFNMGATYGTLHQVKSAIRSYKSKADTSKAPIWAAKATKLAKIIDNYKED